ncbi:type IV toxin-antitoxin system AbiEi family antitoxin [Chlamydiota bacterium]
MPELGKLQKLLSILRKGIVYTQKYLSKLGYYHDLIKSYRRNGWIESIGTGAFKLSGDQIDWFGGVYTLQNQLKLPVYVGGRTALQLKGFAHYGRLGKEKCFLFGEKGTQLPKWFTEYDWGVDIQFKATNLLPFNFRESFMAYNHKDFEIVFSAPERSVMEMLYYIPNKQGFDEARHIMESLMSLRPKLIQKLLEECRQIKVKRIFLYMADKLEMPWFDKIEMDQIDLGKGKLMVVENGVLDNKYLITVPRGEGV